MKRTLITLLALALALFGSIAPTQSVQAQEFKCDVRVNSNKIAGTDKSIFESLQTALYEFINNTKWTNVNFKPTEKIECSMVINIQEKIDATSFRGELNLALKRPTYKATYSTPLFNYIDTQFPFSYSEGEALDFNPNIYSSNLTSAIAYYLYMFLGFEFDSFSLYGGEEFYKVASNIVSAAQSTGESGWSSNERRNRYVLCENLTNESYKPLREFLYGYHRLGLDVMSEDPNRGRESITNAIFQLESVYNQYPMCYFLQLIVETKRDEIIQVYTQGNQKDKTEVSRILKSIDPSQATRYDAILQNGKL